GRPGGGEGASSARMVTGEGRRRKSFPSGNLSLKVSNRGGEVGGASMGKAITVEGCAMAPMVEADRDGRLDAREQASLRRHLTTWASCRRLADDLASLRELAMRRVLPEVTPLDHQRGRAALLRSAAHAQPPPWRPSPLHVRLAAAAAVVLVAGT